MKSGRGNNQHDESRQADRVHTVAVRLNSAELAGLDARRGGMQRGTYLRHMLLGTAPAAIPELNREAWLDLGRSLGNLATIASAMRAGQYIEFDAIRPEVDQLRRRLIGMTFDDDPE